ncbi:hypothetical protein NDU88_002535 [Pleurodeles waltl]|uniref:Uncharacterized protein n=1 Tax=Pleurodeles waltl TaxID=8319 RepID=A0AAV7T2B5_PLEWA|nr:hypothetical protein NDU88_002535 [Pleurodeles waltl]
MVGYCCQWIPNFSIISKPLVRLTVKEVQDGPGAITMSEKEMKAFMELRESMSRAPAFGMPDYTKPFVLFCHERDACSLSVLTQVHGGANRTVAYFSATLDPVAAALPGCLRAVAAVGQSLTQCEGIVMGHPLTVMVPHSVEILLTRTKTQHMTNARLTKYETIILGSSNVSLKRCTVSNLATLLPVENADIDDAEEVEHDCLEVTDLCTKPRPDIKDTQLEENYYIIFIDGSCLRDAVGVLRAGYAVCTITCILEASWLERVYSAQVAELIALTRACHAAENLKVTIYTDSRCGFRIVHDFGQLWSQRGFMTSSGSPVKNGEKIKDLLHAFQLPLEIAVVKCNAHVKSQDFVSMGNGYADQVASHWIEAYPTSRNDSLTVAKLLLRELRPRFGFPISLESDRGRHFDNELIKLLCAALNIEQKLHCSYRPEASRLVEQMNGTLKSRMAIMCAATNLKWPDALPLVLMSMRNTPDKKTRLSPHEILMGRAMRLPAVPANALVNITDDMVLDYCKGLADMVRSFSHQVEATTLPPISDPGHTLKAGDWVVVKKHVRKSCLEPRWKGPYQVILTTTTAVKCAGLPNWIHASHTKKVTCPTDEELEVSKTTVAEKEVSGPESIQRETETEGEPAEDGLITQAANEFQMGDGEGSEAEGSRGVLTPPEPLAEPSRENTIAQEEGAVQRPERPSRKKTLQGDNWPEPQAAGEKVIPNETIEEEVDTTRKGDLSEGELQGDRKLKRKRVANRRYAGPEWAYATSAEWHQEFLAFCFDRAVPGQYYGT